MMNPNLPARLLVADDDFGVRTGISLMLRSRGYGVDQAASGRAAIEMLANIAYDLLLLDISLPDLDGVEVLLQARALQPQIAIVVLTGHPAVEQDISAVKNGHVVEFLRKPAAWREIEGAISRALDPAGPARPAGQLVWPPLTLDVSAQRLRIRRSAARQVDLTRGETAVLAVLMARPGHVHSCAELARQALNYTLDEDEARLVIRPYIFRLRGKIELEPARPQFIHNIRGLGYRLGQA